MFGVRPGLHAQYYLFGTRSNNGQNKAYFGFGDTSGSLTNIVQYNRMLSFSNNTESSNSNYTTGGKMPGNFACFSNYSSKYYIYSGYTGSTIDGNTNTQSLTTNTSGTISSSWGTPLRRSGNNPAGYFGIRNDASAGNTVWYGGYSDTTSLIYANGNYLTTSTETGGALTSVSTAFAYAAGFSSYQKAYFAGGYDSVFNLATLIQSRDWSTGTVATNGNDIAAGYLGYGICNWGYAYRFGGGGGVQAYNNTMRMNFYNETKQTGTSLPSTQVQYAGVTSASDKFGYLWTGYRGTTLNRFLNLYSWSTSTFSDNSYTTADPNSGWIQASAGV